MKLYTFDAAPNPARLKLFMAYKGIEIDTVQLDMMKAEHRKEPFLSVNPEATVPALLLDDGTVLTAVIAMAHYLESLYPEKPLLGETAEQRARVLNASHHLFTGAFSAVAEMFRNGNPAFAGRALPGPLALEQIPALVERGKIRLDAALAGYEQHLASSDFVAGDFVSFADIDLLTCLNFAGWATKHTLQESHEYLHRWRDRTTELLQIS